MFEPVFTREEESALTYCDDSDFGALGEKAALIAANLHLGRDEAGVLDKKLDPDLLHLVSRIVGFLHQSEYEQEAERQLAVQSDPDMAIAILRQAFRIRSGPVNQLLVRKLTNLCQVDETGVAKEAVREATGSELKRLNELADEVFLKVGTAAELLQVASDPHRSLTIRIRACSLLIERHRNTEAVPIALDLFERGAGLPEVQQPLRHLSRAFGALEALDSTDVTHQVVSPVLESLEKNQRKGSVRRYLLLIVAELHVPVLDAIRDIEPWRIGRSDMWRALAMRECAFHNPAATQFMIDLLGDEEVDAYFRLRLSRRIRDSRVRFPHQAVEGLEALLDALPDRHEAEMRENILETISNAKGESEAREASELYAEILQQYRDGRQVEERLMWELRHTWGAMLFLRLQLDRMDEDALALLLQIIGHEGFKGYWAERLYIVIDVYPRLASVQKSDALRIVSTMASNEPRRGKARTRANEFLAELVDGGEQDSELARQYWKQLGEYG